MTAGGTWLRSGRAVVSTTGGRRRIDPPLSAAASHVLRANLLPSFIPSNRKGARSEAQLEAVARLLEIWQERELRRAREPGPLSVRYSHVERVLRARRQRRRIDFHPFARRELGPQAVLRRLDPADKPARVLYVNVSPVAPDPPRPAPVLGAMESGVEGGHRPRVLDRRALVEEAPLAVQAQSARLAKLAEQFLVHGPILGRSAPPRREWVPVLSPHGLRSRVFPAVVESPEKAE